MRAVRTSRLKILSILCLLACWTCSVAALRRPSHEFISASEVMGRRNDDARMSTSSCDSFGLGRKETTDGRLTTSSYSDAALRRSLQVAGGEKAAVAPAPRNPKKVALIVSITAILAYLVWIFRVALGAIFSKEKIQSKTLEILGKLDSLPKHYSYASYVGGMALWEVFGLSTIPVETAAGMVFGWNAVLLSGSGKLMGATIAFLIGRYGALAHWIQSKLSSNSFLQLASHSTEDHPLRVAFLMKMSSFPETIKNYGSALLSPIKFWMFMFATAIHGTTFSALWTYLGVDTAARLENVDLPADTRLGFLLGAALFNGIVVSPLSMAYWVKSMQKSKQESKNKRK